MHIHIYSSPNQISCNQGNCVEQNCSSVVCSWLLDLTFDPKWLLQLYRGSSLILENFFILIHNHSLLLQVWEHNIPGLAYNPFNIFYGFFFFCFLCKKCSLLWETYIASYYMMMNFWKLETIYRWNLWILALQNYFLNHVFLVI